MNLKKSIPLVLLFGLFTDSSYSLDTISTKYLPLQVGNVWVYSYVGTPNSGRTRIKITNTTNSNGHIYYSFELNGNTCTCAQFTYSPFLTQLQPMRIDSNSGNLMFYGTSCQWQINEHLLDSLRVRIGDSVNNACNHNRCYDTSQQIVFGTLRKTKKIGFNIMTYYYFRTYAMDIGLISSIQGCTFSGTCTYTLTGCVINGIVYGDTSFPVGISQISSDIPKSFELNQNYPNPFNPATKIRFALPRSSFAKLIIYDMLGREVETIVDEFLKPGTYEVEWNASKYPSGVYYYKLTAENYNETKKMVLIK